MLEPQRPGLGKGHRPAQNHHPERSPLSKVRIDPKKPLRIGAGSNSRLEDDLISVSHGLSMD